MMEELCIPHGSSAHGGSVGHADQWTSEALRLGAEESMANGSLIFGIDGRGGEDPTRSTRKER